MGKILGTVEQYLVTEGWNYEPVSGRNALQCGIKGQNSDYRMFFDVDEEAELLLLFVVIQANTPEGRRSALSEFIIRANWGLRVGNFELDLRDGEVRYKVSIDVEGGQLMPKMIENMIGAGVSTLDRYFPGIMAVSYAGEGAESAITQIEQAEGP